MSSAANNPAAWSARKWLTARVLDLNDMLHLVDFTGQVNLRRPPISTSRACVDETFFSTKGVAFARLASRGLARPMSHFHSR